VCVCVCVYIYTYNLQMKKNMVKQSLLPENRKWYANN
jgi:hypothetical protein